MTQATLIVIQESHIESKLPSRGWQSGPLALSVIKDDGVETRTGEFERLSYFSHRIASALYPAGRRKWRSVERGFLEVLIPPDDVPNSSHLFAWHISLGDAYIIESAVDDVLLAIKEMPTQIAAAMSVELSNIQTVRSYYMFSAVAEEWCKRVRGLRRGDCLEASSPRAAWNDCPNSPECPLMGWNAKHHVGPLLRIPRSISCLLRSPKNISK